MGNQQNSYRRALEEAIREFEELSKQRARIDERLARLVQTLSSLSRLCRLTPTVQLGLTDACRMVLKAAGRPLAAAEIRGRLEVMGFDCSGYSNPLASIHTVLRRLCRSGEAKFARRPYGKPAFSWKPPTRIVALSKASDAKLNLWWTSMAGEPAKGDKR